MNRTEELESIARELYEETHPPTKWQDANEDQKTAWLNLAKKAESLVMARAIEELEMIRPRVDEGYPGTYCKGFDEAIATLKPFGDVTDGVRSDIRDDTTLKEG